MFPFLLLALSWSAVPAASAETQPIINGDPAETGDYPSAGAVLIGARVSGYGNMRMLLCSSDLIAPDAVLLAAHCVDDEMLRQSLGNFSELEFWWSRQADLSEFDGYSFPDWPEGAVKAAQWYANDDFDIMTLGMGLAHNYDVGLLFLDTPVLAVPYAYLPTAEEGAQLAVDVPVEAVGWGQTTDDRVPPAGTYGTKMMGASYIAELSDWEFQVGANVKDVRKCHGDSGGPSFMTVTTDSPETLRQVGITSHAYDMSDCERTGGVDTRVDAYLDWIDATLRAHCADGTRTWCEVEGIIPPPEPEPVDTGDGPSDHPNQDDATGDGTGACGCSSSGSGLAGLLPLLLAIPLSRTRRRARSNPSSPSGSGIRGA
jgi:hypothetical protein